MTFKKAKAEIRRFMRNHYTDERLAMLLAHAEDGRLAYYSCCCFIGVLTADHPLRGHSKLASAGSVLPGGTPTWMLSKHYGRAKQIPGSDKAELAYLYLADFDNSRQDELIKLIRAEMKRRDKLANAAVATERVPDAVSNPIEGSGPGVQPDSGQAL